MTDGKVCIIIKYRKVVLVVYVHLKELRESLGMTQAEFGKSIGIAKSTYNNYETGAREPKSDFWVAIAKKYNVTIDYLMGYSNDPHRIVEGTSSATAIVARRLSEIFSPDQMLRTLAAWYGSAENMGELVDVVGELDDGIREALATASIGILSAIHQGNATVVDKEGNPIQQPTDGPQAAPAPQEGKDITPATDAPETPPEGE